MILKYVLNQCPDLDRMFHALADATRRDLLERLGRGPASVSELARPLTISLPAVFQHLQVLEAAGLVVTRKAGRVRTCELEPRALQQVERWVEARRHEWERRLDRLGAYLAETADPTDTDEGSPP
jgi:DNA-binding transcriptional ArsR family regulator